MEMKIIKSIKARFRRMAERRMRILILNSNVDWPEGFEEAVQMPIYRWPGILKTIRRMRKSRITVYNLSLVLAYQRWIKDGTPLSVPLKERDI